MKIALIQISTIEEQPEINLLKIVDYSKKAKDQGAKIIMFPGDQLIMLQCQFARVQMDLRAKQLVNLQANLCIHIIRPYRKRGFADILLSFLRSCFTNTKSLALSNNRQNKINKAS